MKERFFGRCGSLRMTVLYPHIRFICKSVTMFYTVYILECSDQTLYTGCTNNLEKRIHAHNTFKTGAKYTRARRPVKVVYCEEFKTLAEGRKREAEIKRMTRKEKLRLCKIKK